MNWRTTWILVAFAAGLFAFIALVERNLVPTYEQGPPPSRLFAFRAAEVTNVALRITNQLVLRAERAASDNSWSLVLPSAYPAHGPAIEVLLHALEELAPPTFIQQRELTADRRTLADFGLDLPPATLTLLHGGKRTEILFGNKTPIGDQVYLQLLDRPGAYLVPAEIYDRLPRSHHDWRDPMLFSTMHAKANSYNRMDVRASGRSNTIELAEGAYKVTRPMPARADAAKVGRLLQILRMTQVSQFVTDNPRADLEPYGLQPPDLEVAFGSGTNDLVVVQFGRSPTNDPSVVYARRMAQTNVVLVGREILDAFQTTFNDLRDLHLVTVPLTGVDGIEVLGTDSFNVRRATNGTWTIGLNGTASAVAADAGVIQNWINDLARLEGTVEKDVVTDFKTLYFLDPPARQYLLRVAVTNAAGATTNVTVGELDLGARLGNKVFARRPDEATVYSLDPKDVARLPYAAWQLRDRRVWSFTTNSIARLTVRHRGQSKTIQRNPAGSWSIAEGTTGMLGNFAAIEETMFRLGELRASVWVAQGDENKAAFGFEDAGDQLSIELRNSDRPRVLILEFGSNSDRSIKSPTGFPYALAVADGQTSIFEFPPALYIELLRYVVSPLFPAAE